MVLRQVEQIGEKSWVSISIRRMPIAHLKSLKDQSKDLITSR